MIYCTENGFVPEVVGYLLDKKERGKANNEAKHIVFWKLAKLVKPLSGKMFVGGAFVDKEFYQESEWRYTPNNNITETAIFQSDFDEKIEDKNKEAEAYKLQFSPADIKYIFVEDDNDIPMIVDFINNNLDQYPLNDLKILSSRIISLRTIESDL